MKKWYDSLPYLFTSIWSDRHVLCILWQRGCDDIERFFKQMVREVKPMGKVIPQIVSVHVNGAVATIFTLETIEEAPVNKKLPTRRQLAAASPRAPKRKVLNLPCSFLNCF